MKDNKDYEETLVNLLKQFSFITVDFGAGEVIVDPVSKGCLSTEGDTIWDIA